MIRHSLHQDIRRVAKKQSVNNYGIVIPKDIELVHGPGCPVCVTPLELIDKAVAIASMKDVISLEPVNISIHPLAIKKKREINIRKRNKNDEYFWYNVMDTLNIGSW